MAILKIRVSLPEPVARFAGFIHRHLPPLNFVTLHYLYFVGVCLVASIVLWGSSTPARSVRFIDCVFLTVSAMTLAGLNTVNISQLNTWQQVLLLFLIMLGSAILVSALVVHVRLRAFEKRFASIVEESRRRRAENRLKRTKTLPLSLGRSLTRRLTGVAESQEPGVDGVVVHGSVTLNGGNVSLQEEKGDSGRVDGQVDEAPTDHDGPPEQPTDKARDSLPQLNTNISAANGAPTKAPSPESEREENVEKRNVMPSAPPVHPAIDRIRFRSDTRFSKPSTDAGSSLRGRSHARVFTMTGVGARQGLQNHPSYSTDQPYIPATSIDDIEEEVEGTHKYFPSHGWITRNSQFQGLSLAEREKLGGVEYRALVYLSYIVPIYFVSWQLLGAIACGAWIAVNRPGVAGSNGLNPWWVGAFNAVSAFNNSGMSLLDANLVAFQTSIFTLIAMGLLILAGNTAYPVFLRITVWIMKWLLPDDETFRDSRVALQFLLDHPRRCYTTLFPKAQTYWLVFSLFCLNGFDWVMFEIINIGNDAIESIPAGYRWLDGLFQALAVRSGGFYVVPVSSLRSGLLVLYLIMMYISVYPITITMRSSNTYEERSLGIYADQNPIPPDEAATNIFGALKRRFTVNQVGSQKETRAYFIRQQLRGQLAHDIWWICVAVFLITVIETSQFERDPVVFSTFNIIFETISAYGCVGISTGVPWAAYSFSGAWHTGSKLILCAVMLRGRHRGLPVAIDRAVLLPGENLSKAEEEDAKVRLEKSISRVRTSGIERDEGRKDV